MVLQTELRKSFNLLQKGRSDAEKQAEELSFPGATFVLTHQPSFTANL